MSESTSTLTEELARTRQALKNATKASDDLVSFLKRLQDKVHDGTFTETMAYNQLAIVEHWSGIKGLVAAIGEAKKVLGET